ncbi:MAG: radical SAM protein, partial [bacterium]|nr:radical SAM protein [bacterium]
MLYVHTPFCVQKCFYCIYQSREPAGREELEEFYTRVLPEQIQRYRSALEQVGFQQIYFGGGTPTIADAEMLEGMYKQIPGFDDIPLKAGEASPYTVTDRHIDLFHKYDFKYISLGVQTLSERILKKQNRLVADKDKLAHICRRLDAYGIINNIDLIFYLDTGGLEDLPVTTEDLEYVMSELRPVSITLHYNYMSAKSPQKRLAMIRLIRRMIEKYPAYRCVNALLEDDDVTGDMNGSAEYRLMREQQDFVFYMIPKIPESHTFGHNMLALGEYH